MYQKYSFETKLQKLSLVNKGLIELGLHVYTHIYSEFVGGGWVGRWCWITFGAGASYLFGKKKARACCACSSCGGIYLDIFLSHIISSVKGPLNPKGSTIQSEFVLLKLI